METDIFNTANFKPSSQVVSSRPALKPEDLAAVIVTVLETPPHVQVGLVHLFNAILSVDCNHNNIERTSGATKHFSRGVSIYNISYLIKIRRL